jgi:hypothetical protein
VFFMALVIAPALLGNQLTKGVGQIEVAGLLLKQPVNWNNNDTTGLQTGTGNATNDMATNTGSASGAASTDTSGSSSGDDAAAAAAAAAAGARLVRRVMFSY